LKEDVITIYEDYPNDLPGYEKHLQNLYVLRDIIGKQNFSLQSDGSLRIKHFVGFFQRGNTRIQILPKIYSTSNDLSFSETELAGSLAFIYRMLWWSGFFNFKKLSKQLLSSAKSDLLEIFIGIFITEFIDLYRKNLLHKYEQQEENQQFIKGKIIFPETIRRNPILKHLHHVKYDEHTINNPLNQIFKALIYNLLSKTKINTNKNKLVVGLTFLQDVDLITLYPNLFNSISFDRLNADFLPLFNLARLFFHNQQPGISEGKENTYSFLVPMHLLFENFIAEILCSFSDDYFVFKYHKPQLYLALVRIPAVTCQ